MQTIRKSQAFGCARHLVLAGLAAVLVAGCQTPTGTGAAAGGALGAGIGALAGHCPGAAIAGGLIGAGAGALAGGAVEANRERKAANAAAADAAVRAPRLEDVARMTQSGVQPGTIIEQIRTSGVVYRLTSDQVIWLNNQGVHPDVVRAMQDSVYRIPGYAPGYVYAAPPAVAIVEPAPPPVAIGVGVVGGFRR